MQQINLFQDQFKPKKLILPPQQMLLVLAATCILMVLMSLYASHRNSSLEQLISTQESQSPQQAELLTDNRPLLEAELQSLQQQYDNNQRLLNYLTQHSFGNQQGFSPLLNSLAYHRIDNVWLTSFSFFKGGQSISLEGQSVTSKDIPSYLDNLSEAAIFHGKQFSVFQLEQPEDESSFYSFKLHTNDEGNQ